MAEERVNPIKKILIVSHAMELGGAEKALLGLLETIDTSRYRVDLFLMRHRGELIGEIPESVNLLPEISEYADLAVPITDVLKKRHFKIAIARFKAKRAAKKRVAELKLGNNDVALEYSHKFTVKYMPPISSDKYDLAISFLTPHYFAAEKCEAKSKIAWIHTDYSFVQTDRESQIEMWRGFDHIAAISDNAANVFSKVFPELEDRVITVQNILPGEYIGRMKDAVSVEMEMPDDGCVKLLSIGRFCEAKNFDNIPDICQRIRSMGKDVKWYIIGYGGDERLIRDRIREFNMEEYVIILGKKANPYPYINACDLYVQPSRYEGKCVSVCEAQMLGKPVAITNYATSASQLENGVDGIIVPMDNEGCARGIVDLLLDKDKITGIVSECRSRDYSNRDEISKLYGIMEN